ncbi:hypothetical protein [Actinomadura yumaensis]|uniref:Uncharacterized protein n=1 Tax=Actinomadura yumaensis TaxID=111807 RepID=A0ABW2CU30_9ACTN
MKTQDMAKNPALWLDAAKFVPGWLAFGATTFAGVRKWRHRHRLLAMGPNEDIREVLYTAKRLITDIIIQGRRQDWFREPEQRDLPMRLDDCFQRVSDGELRRHLMFLAAAWSALAAVPSQLPMVTYGGTGITEPIEGPELEAMRRQKRNAPTALGAADDALARLNALERKATGR